MTTRGVADVVAEEEPFPLEVRVLKKFTPYLGKQPTKHRYMVLIDQKGDAIEGKCEVKDTHIYASFKEDSCYKIDGHICTAARSLGRLVDHEASILIAKRAKFHPIADRPIPRSYYRFATYEMLPHRESSNNKVLTDYLGLIESASNVYKQKTFNLMKIKLLDQEGYNVMLTLWEKVAFAFNTEDVIGKVLVVTSAKVTKHLDEFQLESTDITTLQVNPAIEGLQAITERLRHLQTNKRSNPAMQLALSNTETVTSIAELMMKNPTDYKNKRFTFQGKIKEFEEYRGWFTSKCAESGFKSQLYREKGRLICAEDHQFDHPIYTYCVNAIIVDDSGVMPAVIYNDEMQEILGMSCKTLIVEKGYDNSKKLPPMLLTFIGKLMSFTVRLRENTTPVIQGMIEIETTRPENVERLLLTPAPKTPAKTGTRARDQAEEAEPRTVKRAKPTKE